MLLLHRMRSAVSLIYAGLQKGFSCKTKHKITSLQGQCLYDRGCFVEALEAFSKAAEVKPGCRVYEVRRSGRRYE